MKKVFFLLLAAGLLVACSQEEVNNASDGNNETVTIKFSPYDVEAMTRATTSIATIATHLDVWIYESGNEVEAVHQTSSDADFGSLTVNLNKTKTYTLYAVAHKATDAATLTDGVIAFPDDKVTHSMIYTTTFSPATTTNINAEMTRIVGMLRFELADVVPENVAKFVYTIEDTYTRWNFAGIGTNQTERVGTINLTSRNNDGGATLNLYIIPTNLADTDNINITFSAQDASSNIIEERTFTDVPVKADYKTTYHGTFFVTSSETAAFTVESDFTALDTVEY